MADKKKSFEGNFTQLRNSFGNWASAEKSMKEKEDAKKKKEKEEALQKSLSEPTEISDYEALLRSAGSGYLQPDPEEDGLADSPSMNPRKKPAGEAPNYVPPRGGGNSGPREPERHGKGGNQIGPTLPGSYADKGANADGIENSVSEVPQTGPFRKSISEMQWVDYPELVQVETPWGPQQCPTIVRDGTPFGKSMIMNPQGQRFAVDVLLDLPQEQSPAPSNVPPHNGQQPAAPEQLSPTMQYLQRSFGDSLFKACDNYPTTGAYASGDGKEDDKNKKNKPKPPTPTQKAMGEGGNGLPGNENNTGAFSKSMGWLDALKQSQYQQSQYAQQMGFQRPQNGQNSDAGWGAYDASVAFHQQGVQQGSPMMGPFGEF